MSDSISPPTSLVTAYKAYAAATDRSPPSPSAQGDGQPDRFGPAVTPPPPQLSSSMQGAMEQAARTTDGPQSYDRSGNLRGNA
jgi:hypothetical protein